LGRCTGKASESFKMHVERLVSAASGVSHVVDDSTVAWLSRLDDVVYGKLAGVGLVAPRMRKSLGEFLDGYLAGRSDLKPNSVIVYRHTIRTLKDYFGEGRPLRGIDEAGARAWRESLGGQGLSEATIAKRTANAKVFFSVAVKRKLIAANPFSELDSRSRANRTRQRYISREDTQKLLAAAPCADWRLIISLARYAGLRCPSEILALRWTDINWADARILVTSPKTERFEGRGSREIPLFPELVEPLQDVFEQAPEGAVFVIRRYKDAVQNLRTTLLRIVRRAGLEPWPRLFQNLRASAETDLATRYPLHVATAWIGNTARIAERHYLQIPDSLYEQASRPEAAEGGKVTCHAAQKAAHEAHFQAQQAAAIVCNTKHGNPPHGVKNGDLQNTASVCASLPKQGLETKGIEPSFPRCDRGVLPLHHVPRMCLQNSIIPHIGRHATIFAGFFPTGAASMIPPRTLRRWKNLTHC